MLRYAITSITIIAVLNAAAQVRVPLRMDVKVMPHDPSRVIIDAPTAKTYVGFLRNISKAPVLLQIISVPGRQEANRSYGACYLERWDSTSHGWVYLPAAVIGAGPISVYNVTLDGGEAVDVCGRPSTQELKPSGTCYRFTLRVQLKGFRSPSILSQTFKAVAQAEGLAAKCQP